MEVARQRLIFDTSALNALADDQEAYAIIGRLRADFYVRFSDLSISEIVATKNPARRVFLLRLCGVMLHKSECIKPHQWIIDEMAREYLNSHVAFDWRRVNVRWTELEDEIAARSFRHDAVLTAEMVHHNRRINKMFLEAFRDARAQFEAKLRADPPIGVVAVIESLKAGPLWKFASDFCMFATGTELTEDEARTFIDLCPPVRSFLVGLCIAQYHWAIREIREKALFDAGALDYFASVVLPYCDRFITADEGQYAAFKLIASEAGLTTEICTYADFRYVCLI